MTAMFRSEEMTLAQLFLQSEAAYSCVRELGELGKVQFRDVNADVNAFQRKFINEVRRCDEMERKLRFLNTELEKANITPRPGGNVEAPDPQDMIDLEGKFEVLETEVKEINTNKETLKKNLLDLIELQHILEKTRVFFQEAEQYAVTATPRPRRGEPATTDEEVGREDRGLLEEQTQATGAQTKFTFVTGVIARERVVAFERVLWRACRGNVFLRQADIQEPLEDPTTGLPESKVVFILFFQGDQLRSRVRKICEGFRATLYQCPETAGERAEMTTAIGNRIRDLRSVLDTTETHSITQLNDIAQELDTWKTKVKKIKSIYHILNMFNLDVTQRCLIAECWCPVEELEQIQAALTRGTQRSGSSVPSILNRMATDEAPPTYNKVNKFTTAFQSIVDAYGVATYQEVNPALYTIITFPFLFAVMFGDAGHGTLMALFALMLIIFEKKLANFDAFGEMFTTLFDGRYIIFLMGLFSIYTGLIYNDVFSKSLNIFGSSWNITYSNSHHDLQPDDIGGCCPNPPCVQFFQGGLVKLPREAMVNMTPYPFGLDPIWNVAENKLVYTNSYKMKTAIILGVVQMMFGVCLQVFNHVHFKHYLYIVMEFIPQVLFLMCLFGWLVLLIFYKWCYFYVDPNTAPNLLITLINMFLKFGSNPDTTVEDPGQRQYSVFGPTQDLALFQRYLQVILVIVALVSVPWMLFTKPIYLLVKHKRAQRQQFGYRRTGRSESFNVTPDGEPADQETAQIMHHDEASPDNKTNGKSGDDEDSVHGEEKFEFSEIFIHQAIHTIEYCLGTISNTASYLRLWALSLAHAELSEVLWNMVFQLAIGISVQQGAGLGVIVLFLIFAAWAAMTVGILLVMEGLSAFLHALRLHWVEFQNKFYDGNGHKFSPFSFAAILKGEED